MPRYDNAGRKTLALALLIALTGCTPSGSPCRRDGDVKVAHGASYVCGHNSSGKRVWRRR